MEPGLRGREDTRRAVNPSGEVSPLWSPAFGAGKTTMRSQWGAARVA